MVLLIAWVTGCGWGEPAPRVAPPPLVHHAVRVALDEAAAELQAPLVTLERAPDRQVLVVGAVHVADPGYYVAIGQALRAVDVVLAEGVTSTPSEAVVEAARGDAFADEVAPYGLALQARALIPDDRWVGADMTTTELREALRRAGANQAWIRALLDDRDRSSVAELFEHTGGDPRLVALARLALLSSLAEPTSAEGPDGALYWNVVIGERNAVASAAALARTEGRLAVVYGADHLGDLTARFERAGYAVRSKTWLTVLRVAYADLGLGKVQVQQLLERES